MKRLILLGLMALISLSVNAQNKKQIIFNKIDTSIVEICRLRNDTLFVKVYTTDFENWFNKQKIKPVFSFIKFEYGTGWYKLKGNEEQGTLLFKNPNIN
jgi:hypothetical protein